MVLCHLTANACCEFFPVCCEFFPVRCEFFPECCEFFPVCCEIFPICCETFPDCQSILWVDFDEKYGDISCVKVGSRASLGWIVIKNIMEDLKKDWLFSKKCCEKFSVCCEFFQFAVSFFHFAVRFFQFAVSIFQIAVSFFQFAVRFFQKYYLLWDDRQPNFWKKFCREVLPKMDRKRKFFRAQINFAEQREIFNEVTKAF